MGVARHRVCRARRERAYLLTFLCGQNSLPLGVPTIPIAVQTPAGERIYMFLLDTGADFSVAPCRLAQQVGLEWTTLPEAQVVGVEQGGVRARVGPLPIRLVH